MLTKKASSSVCRCDFSDRGGYKFAAGDQLRITATYDNVTGKPLPAGAMGIVVGYFLPADDSAMSALRRKPKPTHTPSSRHPRIIFVGARHSVARAAFHPASSPFFALLLTFFSLVVAQHAAPVPSGWFSFRFLHTHPHPCTAFPDDFD